MKKLILTFAFVLGIMSFSNAQEKEKMMRTDAVATVDVEQVEYSKIDKSMLPIAVKDAVMNDLEGMAISEAYVSANDYYKLVVNSQEDQIIKTVYINKAGEWLKIDDKS
mgnify:CR=1 FL=1|tara:strand:- start:138 stop:464 length:327 start_codon:yes stop_codon:yes gene_type:complete